MVNSLCSYCSRDIEDRNMKKTAKSAMKQGDSASSNFVQTVTDVLESSAENTKNEPFLTF